MNLINNDCLKEIPIKVDMVFTSVPFKEEDVEGDYWEQYDKWFKGMMDSATKLVVIIHSATKLNTLIQKYPPKRTMIWGKGISQYSWRWNPILVYQISDEYKVNKFIWCDVFGVESVIGKWKVHKYQDPELLYETIIKMFKVQSVLDPFMGSGTTGVVCKKLGIDFTGIEMDKEKFEVAKNRIEGYSDETLYQQNMLGDK